MRANSRTARQAFLERNTSAKYERACARRYPFVASIELTDLQSETHIREQTSDLSLFGCHVDADHLLLTGTTVRIRIVHAGASFVALGKVAYAVSSTGMGVAFTKIEPNYQLVLDNWIGQLRDAGEKQAKV